VLVPFVQALSGNIKILPIAVPPVEESIAVGELVGRAAENKSELVAVASTDLTHYGEDYYGWAPKGAGVEALNWVKNVNDKAVIDAMLEMDPEKVMETARIGRSACGAGAVAAVISFAKALGADSSELLHYTTSYDVRPDGAPSDFVGYAGVLFGNKSKE